MKLRGQQKKVLALPAGPCLSRRVSSDVKELPNDVEELKRLVLERSEALEQERKRRSALEEQNALLKQALYGRKSEKLSPEEERQSLLFNEAESGADRAAEEEPPATEVKPHRRRKPGRKPIPESLPRTEIVHDIPEVEKTCACGSQLSHIGDDISEELEVVPQQVVVKRHVRRKYVCRSCEGTSDESRPAVRAAPLPRLLPGAMAGPGMLAYVMVSKFCDALPFYRQEKIFQRLGVEIPRATLCNWTVAVAERLSRLRDLLHTEVRAGPCVCIDETPVQVLKEPGRAATQKSYMWVMRGGEREHPVITYEYRTSRGGEFLRDRLSGYHGGVMSDGYVGYEWLKNKPGITIAACWAHVRRGFFKAHQLAPESEGPKIMLDLIRKLYRIEKDLRDLSPIKRLKRRKREAAPVLQEIRDRIDSERLSVVPSGQYGKALAYTDDLWDRLIAYANNGEIPIDNNDVENSIRPFVVGRKNWLFFDTQHGAHAGTLLFSLIETAKANGHEPYWYLRYLFDLFPVTPSDDAQLRELLPHRVTAAQIERRFESRRGK